MIKLITMRKWSTCFFCVCAAVAGLHAQSAGEAYKNPDLAADRRAADLVSRMTLEEKVLQMQNSAPAIPRLGVPAYDWWNEALHGVARAGEATVFPQAIGLAATWDTDLMHRIADAISTEARAKYNKAIAEDNHARYFGLTFWSPNINIFRDPRWGRGQETYGEDPFLTGRLAVAFIKGMQGDDPHYYKVIATAKHYAVHSGPEPSRHEFDVKPSERDLNDTYLPAFRAAIMEGKADSVMCAYNAVDGVPACANTDLLVKHLRGDWNFQGYVVSDCGAINDIFRGHKYKATAAEASAVAVKAGTDLTCGNEYRSLVDAVKNGLIDEGAINRSLERLFKARFQLGMFDPPERVPFSKIPYSVNDSDEHRKLALEAARKSIVLLKNEKNALPLSAAANKIAVIGPPADDPVALMGNYNGFSKKQVTPLEGMQRQFAGKVSYALGATYTAQSASLIPSQAFTQPNGGGPGLLAEYFDNDTLQGSPKVSHVESRPLLQGGMVSADVAAAFPKGGYSVRWSGELHPPVTGDYALSAGAAFGRPATRLFIDDKEVTAGAPGGQMHAHFEAGHSYAFRAEYRAQRMGANVQVSWIPPAEPLLAEALEVARNADVVVAFAGLNPNLEGEEMRVSIPGFAGGDRTDLKLPETQEKLLEAAIGTGKPVIVVLTSGSAVAVNDAAAHAAAVLQLWYGGEEAGTAIAETLAGVNNPSGRLPLTFYRGVEQLPPFDDYSMNGRTYRYFKGDALYDFGFGLSYSQFEYSRPKAQRSAGGGKVTVRVSNKSNRDGDEVAELYIEGDGAANSAIRQLRGFQRVHLKAGEAREIEFTLKAEDLPKGKVKISVGGGQPVGSVPHVETTI
ncbi:MAG TPA: glycoside hydrolase family 3 C-terminal domain-containing protein [Candidatus Limnocylindrales bacterium]|nr:glycoside hydrolase family 3 C-terminal domain-containing protein [Candidatus Limnocylindrales bacterium]